MKKYMNLFKSNIMVIMAFMFVLLLGLQFSIPEFAGLLPTAGVGLAAVIIANVDDPGNEEKIGKQIKSKLWILPYDNYDENVSFPTITDREIGTIPLAAGKYWYYIDAVTDSVEPTVESTLGDVAAEMKQSIKFIVGGMSKNLLNLLETGIGEKFFVVYEYCGSGTKYLIGTRCKPAVLSEFKGGPGKDYTGFEITFSHVTTKMFTIYTGSLAAVSAVTVAADADTIALDSSKQLYQLTDGSAASIPIDDFSGTVGDGYTFTVLGSGGTYPSTIPSGTKYINKNAATWTAAAGATITYKVLGTTSQKLIEVSRT